MLLRSFLLKIIMERDLKPILFSLISSAPLVGGSISSYLITEYYRDFFESLRYFPLIIGLSTLSSIFIIYDYFRSLMFYLLTLVISLPFVVAFVTTRRFENIRINVNEYYIEINFEVPMKRLSFDDPSSLFDYVYEKALKKIKPPYLQKLRNLDRCGNLKVIPKENSIILRKRCGDTIVEVIITNNEKADMKVTMSY